MNLIQRFEAVFGDLLRWVGVILAAQGVISQYFTSLGVQPRILTAVFGGLGLVLMVGGKWIDSQSYTAIAVAKATPVVATVTTGTTQGVPA